MLLFFPVMLLFFVILQPNPVVLFTILYLKSVRVFVNMEDKKKYNARIHETRIKYEGYHFQLNQSYEDTKYYDCSFRKNKHVKCKARLKIVSDRYILNGTHEGHEKPCQLDCIKKEIQASQPYETTEEIKNRIISKYNNLLHLTKIANVEKSIERYRKKNIGQVPKNMEDLRRCLENENWRQFLKMDEAESFVVDFVIENNTTKSVLFIDKTLAISTINDINGKLTIFVDGTFATVPQLQINNCQLWIIVIRHDNRTFPIVYTIMEGRTTQNYVDVLRKVKNILNITPDIAMCDFEKAQKKALHIVFPSAKIIGCFFHYSQALVHNAGKHKILKGDINELGWGATKLLISLAFLPHTLIEEGFELISKIIFEDCPCLQSFFHYYKETWINGFKPDSFCVFQQVHRTNNICERHNRELRSHLKKHSTIVEFLIYLSEHQKRIRSFTRNLQFWARTKRKSLKEREDNILKIWNDMNNNDNLDLLLTLYKLSQLVGK